MLVRQINILFTLSTFIITMIFFIAFDFFTSNIFLYQNHQQLKLAHLSLIDSIKTNNVDKDINEYEYAGFLFIYTENGKINKVYDENNNFTKYKGDILYSQIETSDFLKEVKISNIGTYTDPWEKEEFSKTTEIDSTPYFFRGTILTNKTSNQIIQIYSVSSNTYSNTLKDAFLRYFLLLFTTIILLGNLIIYIWTNRVSARIKNLRNVIKKLPLTNYQEKIEIEGNDELDSITNEIEKMRDQINRNEQTKRNIIQNVSHDFKTPIAVIVSYAQAIKDGISTIEDLDIIINEADKLNERVLKLISYNKQEYLEKTQEIMPLLIKDVLEKIIKKHQFKFSGKILLKADDTKYKIKENDLENMIDNIVENAIRYAKTKILIKLENGVIEIYNDGPKLTKKEEQTIFMLYEKGNKGQSGVGLNIAQQIANHYRLSLRASNLSEGVVFIIEPL